MCYEGQTLDFQSTALPTELPSLCKAPRLPARMSGLLTKAENTQRSMSNSECFDSLALAHFGLSALTHLCRSQPSGSIREQALDSKPARQFHCSTEEAQVMVSRNFDAAKLLQVRGEPLRVKQRELLRAQMFYQRHQRDLRRIRYAVEH
jgi:hypothetical protein